MGAGVLPNQRLFYCDRDQKGKAVGHGRDKVEALDFDVGQRIGPATSKKAVYIIRASPGDYAVSNC